ncbi:hypothetical protein [Candidatus Nitrosotenuis cloacae]|uniref:hypothetical protein n=1 Tax=Candidatus Nitrosotenuis cloacae TaxID=1603555 RepID=UPI0022822FE5|nr:hypothetical protein [Candidatus Nitrosotenuis cloacae]
MSLAVIGLTFVIVSQYFTADEKREGVRPREGITVVHSDNINVDMNFYFVAAKEPNRIFVRISTSPIANTLPRESMVGIYFPYPVKINHDYDPKHDHGDWDKQSQGYVTMFAKQIPCKNWDDCKLVGNDEIEFILDQNMRFDSKDAYRHGIKIKFENAGNVGTDFFSQFQKNGSLVWGVESTDIRTTTIIPANAQQIHTLPMSQPDVFHNGANDYSNTQLDWTVTKDTHSFFVDYELPEERIAFEEKQNMITALGLVIGVLGIPISIIYGRNMKESKNSALVFKPIIDKIDVSKDEKPLSENIPTQIDDLNELLRRYDKLRSVANSSSFDKKMFRLFKFVKRIAESKLFKKISRNTYDLPFAAEHVRREIRITLKNIFNLHEINYLRTERNAKDSKKAMDVITEYLKEVPKVPSIFAKIKNNTFNILSVVLSTFVLMLNENLPIEVKIIFVLAVISAGSFLIPIYLNDKAFTYLSGRSLHKEWMRRLAIRELRDKMINELIALNDKTYDELDRKFSTNKDEKLES